MTYISPQISELNRKPSRPKAGSQILQLHSLRLENHHVKKGVTNKEGALKLLRVLCEGQGSVPSGTSSLMECCQHFYRICSKLKIMEEQNYLSVL